RVTVIERTNVRYLDPESLPVKADLITADVSFISLSKILPKLNQLSKDVAEYVLLVKPQFEAGRDKVGKKGVVRDPDVQVEVLDRLVGEVNSLDWSVRGLTHSPIRGPQGNIEYLIYASKGITPVQFNTEQIDRVVKEGHKAFML
ncbi:MAG: TlyA family rRNA (cytidine-2'-O)-methyltransferase, partial [Candidatus Desulforudis sp.]|nr:TlyA family rRNA (cytidine-2'-O)-methyltransferase [Bacillota bacterium]MBV1768655.1 TlyA family rRNA (cytidine-2'-O)-methyltransferase [Desulforudis sp.]